MDITKPSIENMQILISEIILHLKMVNTGIITVDDFKLSDYDNLLELYQMVKKRSGNLTMLEMEGILQELGDIRKAHK